jgi:putative acetyltransferase
MVGVGGASGPVRDRTTGSSDANHPPLGSRTTSDVPVGDTHIAQDPEAEDPLENCIPTRSPLPDRNHLRLALSSTPVTRSVRRRFPCEPRLMRGESRHVAIRAEAPEDYGTIRRLVSAAFRSDVEADLVDRIRASPEYVSDMALVAEIDGEPVGHVMVSGAKLRHATGERAISMLSPLAVRPDHQRQGVGAALVEAVLAVADERGEPLVILEGNPAYYSRFGFEHSVPHGIEIHLPDWAPPEAAQVKRLAAFDSTDSTLRGTVVYPPAFDRVE